MRTTAAPHLPKLLSPAGGLQRQGPRRRSALVVAILIFLILLAVSITILLLWSKSPHRSFNALTLFGRMRVEKGDSFHPSLRNSTTPKFGAKAVKYEAIVESLFRSSTLGDSFIKVKIIKFREPFLVFFRLSLDRRKLLPLKRRDVDKMAASVQTLLVEKMSLLSPALEIRDVEVRSQSFEEERDENGNDVASSYNTLISKIVKIFYNNSLSPSSETVNVFRGLLPPAATQNGTFLSSQNEIVQATITMTSQSSGDGSGPLATPVIANSFSTLGEVDQSTTNLSVIESHIESSTNSFSVEFSKDVLTHVHPTNVVFLSTSLSSLHLDSYPSSQIIAGNPTTRSRSPKELDNDAAAMSIVNSEGVSEASSIITPTPFFKVEFDRLSSEATVQYRPVYNDVVKDLSFETLVTPALYADSTSNFSLAGPLQSVVYWNSEIGSANYSFSGEKITLESNFSFQSNVDKYGQILSTFPVDVTVQASVTSNFSTLQTPSNENTTTSSAFPIFPLVQQISTEDHSVTSESSYEEANENVTSEGTPKVDAGALDSGSLWENDVEMTTTSNGKTTFPDLKMETQTSISLVRVVVTYREDQGGLPKVAPKPGYLNVNAIKHDDDYKDFDDSSYAECKEGEYRCPVFHNRCVPRCDRRKDCPDGMDESGCNCKDYLRAEGQGQKVCDGVADCADFSDESNCEWCRKPNHFRCPGSRTCVDQQHVCDGVEDCPNATDELKCVRLVPSPSQPWDHRYRSTGFLMVQKAGKWGALCVGPQSGNALPWELEELGRGVCNALSYNTLISVNSTFSPDCPGYYRLNHPVPQNTSPTEVFQSTSCPSKKVVYLSCGSLECGVRPFPAVPQPRIVGGQSSTKGAWPWQVALYRDGEFQCGAVLVSAIWLLSAGHCFFLNQASYWTARLGMLRRGFELPSPYEELRRIISIVLHPDYEDSGFINDISLLRMDRPVTYSDFIRPACLPAVSDVPEKWEGKLCTVLGWGKLFETGQTFPDALQEVQLPVIGTQECRRRTLFLPIYRITDNMFCAGFERGGRDACLGDSGGPLLCQSGGRWTVVGVTSNGDGCARPSRPGVYTKVANYRPWINQVISSGVEGIRIDDTRLPPCPGRRCPLGKCVPAEQVCDGYMHCLDGSDEANC